MRSFNHIPRAGLALTLAATMGAAACVDGSSAPASNKEWSGKNPSDVSFPGTVALAADTCMKWDVSSPQPSIKRGGLLIVVDSRRTWSPTCSPVLGAGANLYQGASYESRPFARPDGTSRIPDGTVVEVTAYAMGQFACNSGGGSSIWVSVRDSPDSISAWAPIINTGGGPPLDKLWSANVQPVESPYQGTTAPGC